MFYPHSRVNITAGHLAILLVIVLPSKTAGQNIVVNSGEEFEPKTVIAPFAFYNDSLKFGVGPVFVSNGFIQEQLSMFAGGFATTNGSYSLFLFGQDAQLPFGERLFLDWRLTLNHYDDFDQYRDGNPRYWNKRAGSNDSNEDDFINGSGDDNFVLLTFKYLLPIGHGKDTVINTIELDRGLLKKGAAGGAGFNPFKSGRSFVEVATWYRFQDIESDLRDVKIKTNGLRLGLRYDNRDYAQNPTRGNETSISVSRDFGSFDSSGNWTTIEGEFSQYFPLGATENFRSIVLALNFWTAYSPTWADDHGQPPLFAGATLGGLDRMRGFPTSRFYDKAAIYYTAELRMIPEWNPLGADSFMKRLEVDWIMFVPFIEIGRVSEQWSLSELHSDMKWSAGVGFRAMAKHTVIRIGTGVSDEGMQVQMMVQHPF